MGHIFISYSHKDTDYAHALADNLQKMGLDVWIDARIDYGSQWPLEIQKQLDSCDAFIVIMSPRSYASEWVQSELQRAKRKLKPIFPLLLEGDGPWLSVESTQYYDVRGGKKPDVRFYSAIKRVISISKTAVMDKLPKNPTPAGGKSSLPKSKISTWILVAIVGIAATCVVGFFGYQYFMNQLPLSPAPATATTSNTQPQTVTAAAKIDMTARAQQTLDAISATNANASAQQQTATAAWLSADDDGDGLTNDRELKLKTRPDERDTDGDGLDDGAEVINFFTDPLNRDTDGDGQIDSQDDTPRIPSTATPDVIATANAEACFEGDWGPTEFAGDLQLLQINRTNKDTYSFHGSGGCATNCDWGVIDVPANWPILDGTFPNVRFVGAVQVEVTCSSGDQLKAIITEKSTSGDGVVTPKVYDVILKRCASITFGWSCSFD